MRALILVALIGCGGAGPRPAPLEPLGGTVTLTEVTSDGERIAIESGGLGEVDINSRIEVHVDRERVKQVFEAQRRDDPEATARLRSQLRDLSQLTQRQKQAMDRLAALVGRLAKEGWPASPSKGLIDANMLFRSEQKHLNNAIASYATSVGQARAMYFGQDGQETGALETTWSALDRERRRVLAKAAEIAKQTAGLRWRMQAVFAQGKPIHLDNYDTYPDGAFGIVDKLVPQKTLNELAAQLDEAKQLAKDLKDLSSAKQIFVKAALDQIAKLLASLKEDLHGDLDAIAAIAKEIPETVLKLPEVVKVKAELAPLADAISKLRAPCAAVLEAVGSVALDSIQLDQVSQCMRAVLGEGPQVLEHAKLAGAAVQKLIDLVEQQPARLGALLAPLQALAPKLEVVKRAEAWATKVSAGWDQTKMWLELQSQVIDAPVWTTDQQTDHVLEEITDTAIDLRRTDRKEGDLFYFRPSIVKTDGTAAIFGATADFRVARMGTYIDVSAGVSFVDKKDHAWGPFTATPGIVAALHHRWRPNGTGARTLNALRPGIGIHFLYPDLGRKQVDAAGNEHGEDPSFELGVGGTVLLFGDLLQAGIGYDLQVGVSYWYLGFGLDTLAKLGVRFSPGS
ncbi:MAG TPA: hypothetical protein VN253_00515 [Kofleriaceae bacterium]|nr:hypothetical protein [Kofleriaceae bacterium]